MAKAMQKYFCENFDGAETVNIWPSESLCTYGIQKELRPKSYDVTQHPVTTMSQSLLLSILCVLMCF